MNAAKHLPHNNGGVAGNWNVLSSRPLLRGAEAFGARSIHLTARKLAQTTTRII